MPEPDFVLSRRWGTFRLSPSSRTVDRVPGHQVSGQPVIRPQGLLWCSPSLGSYKDEQFDDCAAPYWTRPIG
jgi:hypothetical protein